MPSIPKGYYIDKEEDIPIEYRDAVEKAVAGYEHEVVYSGNITPGKMGASVSDHDSVAQVFVDGDTFYLGHGTPGKAENIAAMIEDGIKVKTPTAARGYISTSRGIESMTDIFGNGDEGFYDKYRNSLDNWIHKFSKNIVIVAVPKKFKLDLRDVGGIGDVYEAFYTGSEEAGYTLRPEFIRGVYNSESHSFIENENYYGNLAPEDRDKLFDEIKQVYIEAYAKYSHFPPKESNAELPLDSEEIEEASVKWYAKQLRELQEDRERQALKPDTHRMDMKELTKNIDIGGFNEASQNIRGIIQFADKDRDGFGDDGDIEWDFDEDKW